jgi:hypothetical protein
LPPFSQSFVAGQVCDFPVTIESARQAEILKTFSNGRQLITGAAVNRVTNDATHRSVLVNASGPGTLTTANGILTITARGRSMWFFFPGDLGAGEPGALILVTGLTVETVNAETGAIIQFSHPQGTTENFCETMR